MSLLILGILIVLLPLGGAVLAGALGSRWLKGGTHWVVVAGVGGAAICSFLLLGQVRAESFTAQTIALYDWIGTGAGILRGTEAQPWFQINFHFDALTAVMLVTVTFVSSLVVIYSRDYMRHHDHPERGYERFFAYLGMFVFSMCVLVLSGNFLLLYFGWEAVGLCSYLLIGFYYQRPAAAAAAKKAFLVNRIGDFGFGLGVLLIYLKCGNLNYDYVFSSEGMAKLAGSEHIVALLLLCGAVGKSAQMPLHVWLPDAMEGPSPVSALIHAATMVTAGVYMVARCGAIFVQSETVMLVVATIGGVTALFAATIALTQYDMKRILAYSTISQLGFMFLALGVYAADAAIFHLFTHAFFKALLFLGAGSVMHAMGGVIDVRKFGGLRKLLPWTFWTFLIGSAALAGLPFLAAFYSKDMILLSALEVHPFLGWMGVLTAALTAFYTFRMVFLAFWGETRVPAGAGAHESGGWMLLPLVLLSGGALGAGYLFHERLPEFLQATQRPFAEAIAAHTAHVVHVSHSMVAIVSSVAAIGGIVLAYVLYVALPELPGALRAASGRMCTLVHNKYFVDEGYDAAIVRPLRKSGEFLYGVDRFFIDGLVWLATAIPRLLGFMLRGMQQGSLQGYGVTMAGGLAILLFFALYYSNAVLE
ncbi:MAG: NADH-quinone oxidoreductase subunit L [Planctomycetes bacterium]|nr:NADH-quinone oxidoreductase subunit L [Planctomycetota bacterium]